MIPTWINPLTCNDVDARLLLVVNVDSFNYFPSEKIYFPCKNVSLVKKRNCDLWWQSCTGFCYRLCNPVQLQEGHLHKISRAHRLLLGISSLLNQYIVQVLAHRALNKQYGWSSRYLSWVFVWKSCCLFIKAVDIEFLFEDLYLSSLMVVERIKHLE